MSYTWILSPFNDSYVNLSQNLIIYVIGTLIPKMLQIILTPFYYPDIFWIILPLIAATILMILYFGRHRNEELGWNSAFGNNIALMFVGINLIQELSGRDLLLSSKAFFIYMLIVYNIVQLFMNYFHLLPKKVSFLINSAVPINVITYLAILIAYSDLTPDSSTMIASIIIFLIIYGISKIIWIFVPMSKGSKILYTLQEKKAMKLKIREAMMNKKNENLNLKENGFINLGIIMYLIIYVSLFLINKLWIDISEYYLIIFSAYFLIYSLIYMKLKRLSFANLLINERPVKKDIGIFIGLLLFFYYIISSNLIIDAFNAKSYHVNNFLLIVSIVFASVSSEVFFRGVVQRALKLKFNKNMSVGISALLWSILKADIFLVTLGSIHLAFFGLIIIYPIGLLLGYLKEEYYLDSAISASLTMSILSVISLFI
ncbi:MAG: CPBP family intramembrane metalloprotease [Patescibacteria group bacterium]|nr:CPBP family intramembrane metalloprotease [Patescibacteria group bacterium]